MKTRHGFVSNSSSSSFVVAFPEKPGSVDELQSMMFTRFQEYVQPYDHAVPAKEICRIVFNEIYSQKESASKERIMENLAGLYTQMLYRLMGESDFPHPEKDDYSTVEEYGIAMRKHWEERDIKAREWEERAARKFMEENKGAFILCTSYADDDSFLAVMEHGDIFRNLKHIQVGHH